MFLRGEATFGESLDAFREWSMYAIQHVPEDVPTVNPSR